MTTRLSQDRIVAAALTALVTALLGWLLLAGLLVRTPIVAPAEVTVFEAVPATPPRPHTVPQPQRHHRAAGAAAPPNLRATATEVVAPPPIVALPLPPPIAVAPIANTGVQPSQGAAERLGPGTGAGGEGSGFGAGGEGNGTGDGLDDETPPRRLRGRLKDSDYPREAAEAGAGGTVSVRYFVEVDGRVSGCTVTRSSGSALLDATTCRLITERFRYRPSLDARGRPVRSIIVVDHEWVMEREPLPDDRNRR